MKISSEIKIGIIITLAIVVTIWGINFLKGRNILTRVDNYHAVFENIGGLEKNAKIYINGYYVGQVGEISFDLNGSSKLIVDLEIRKTYRLAAQSTAVLYDADLMGTKAIEIILGNSESLHEPGDTLTTMIRAGLTDQLEKQLGPVKNKAEDLIESIDSLMTALALVFDRESAELLKESIRNLESSMSGVENMLAKDGKLNQLITHLESITRNLKENNEQLAAAMTNIEAITDSIAKSDLKETIVHTNRTLEQTQEIMEKINKGEGTLGMLVNNDTLYHNLARTSMELELLLKDLQENPKKYINVSVFGGKDKKQKK